MMAACVRTWILKLCVFTKIFLLITAQTEHMRNVAVNKPCNISSKYVAGSSSNDCSAAINNNTDTTFSVGWNCIHTSESDFHPTWSVDLGQDFSVHSITIYGRDLYERRMACVQVWLDGRELHKFSCSGTATVRTDIPVNPPQRGRVVSITNDHKSYTDLVPLLNICEVQIWVCSIGWWGNDCQKKCSCEDKDNHCESDSGTCLKTNVAVHKPCNISSRYEENGLSNDCSAAINGNTNTTFVTVERSKNCIHTSLYDLHPSWSVDLGQDFSVHSITIYGRDNLVRRMDCVQVFLDGRQLYTFPCPGTTTVITDIYVNPVQRGRVVRVTNDQRSDADSVPFLNICEIQIWVCSIGWWGSDCQNQCSCQGQNHICDPDNGMCSKECSKGYWGDDCSNICGRGCKNGDCNVYNGTCECKSGWAAPSCDVCSYGQYNVSNDCHNTCGRGCQVTCSRTDGTCLCQTGWQPPLCQDCPDGHYNTSNDCQNTCGGGCHDTCNKTDGTCQCQTGWQPPLCQVCSDGHYNPSNDCQNTCGRGCHDTCSRTDGTCQCRRGWQSPQCQDCSDGHYNTSNDCQNTCGGGCNDTCSRTDGVCHCRSGWDQPLCQNCLDGHYNVSNDCHNTCGEGCNNTCSKTDGTCQCRSEWEPPLCTNCANGHYSVSNDCHNTCGEGCNNTCNKTDGTCQCQTGWQPPLCQFCSKGWWGSDCQNQCRCQGKDYYCDLDHGTCSKVCSSGYWGENCTVCGAGCSNTCDSKSGACRCTNGWTGPQCTDCSHGHYNMSNGCQNTCGRGCHDTCSRTDGTCQCHPGWQPPLCQHCSEGHYNMSNDCQYTCGEGCHDTCNRTDGTCQCQTGWQSPLCQRINTSVMMSSCDDKEALIGAGSVAGIAVGCAIVFLIIGFLSGLRLRLSRSHQPSATHGSPVKTSVTSDLGTSSTMTHPAEPRGSTSSEDTADHSNNVYDELKARNDDNKSAYTSLRFQNKGKESAASSDYINTRKILMNE